MLNTAELVEILELKDLITVHEGVALIIHVRKREWPKTQSGRRSNIVPDRDSPFGKVRFYFSSANCNVIEELFKRGSEPKGLYKTYIPSVTDRLANHFQLLPAEKMKFSWSRKCGCGMCPCSPGFIGPDGFMTGYDVWVTALDGGFAEAEAYIDAQKEKFKQIRLERLQREKDKLQAQMLELDRQLEAK